MIAANEKFDEKSSYLFEDQQETTSISNLLSVVTAIHEKDTQREEELKTLRERVDSHEEKIRSQNDYIDSLNEITAKPFVQNICVQILKQIVLQTNRNKLGSKWSEIFNAHNICSYKTYF